MRRGLRPRFPNWGCDSTLLLTALTVACSDASSLPREPTPTRYSMRIVSGADQEREVLAELPNPIVIEVRDAKQLLASDVKVRWEVPPGAGQLSSLLDRTDLNGRVSVRWTLGEQAGYQHVVAHAGSVDSVTVYAVGVRLDPVVFVDMSPVRFAGLVNDTFVVSAFGRVANGAVRWVPVSFEVQGEGLRLEPIDSAKARAIIEGAGAAAIRGTYRDRGRVVFGDAPIAILTTSDVDVVYAGPGVSCALTHDRSPYCWGADFNGSLGIPPTDGCPIAACVRTPMRVSGGLSFTSLALGLNNVCGISPDARAYCWGDNFHGQVGAGSAAPKTVTDPTEVLGNLRFRQLAAGAIHVCGLTTDDLLYCWGNNDSGELGNGDSQLRAKQYAPSPVAGELQFSYVTAYDFHTCALSLAGDVYCWGDGDPMYGGTNWAARWAPGPLRTDLKFRQIATGERHTCAISTDDRGYCWGLNWNGEIGRDPYEIPYSSTPLLLPGDLSLAQIRSGERFSYALTTAGALYCWGMGGDGQLGRGSRADSNVPVQVSGPAEFSSFGLGRNHVCASVPSGRAYCWGDSYWGTIGDGRRDTVLVPRAVSVPR